MLNYKIKDLPEQDRPREKLISKGVASLTDAELLAILLRTGTKDKSVLHLAAEIIKANEERLLLLEQKNWEQLAKFKGVGNAKAITIVAALELGRRVHFSEASEIVKISCPMDAAKVFYPMLRSGVKEQAYLMLLNIKNRLISLEKLSTGTFNATVIETREIFSLALSKNAASIILAHNHPSGDPLPSRQDREATNKLMKAGELMDVKVLDHLIIGDGKYYAFSDNSTKKFPL